MGQWYGKCRSNYFRVKDPEAFARFLKEYQAELLTSAGPDGTMRYGFRSTTETGGEPTRIENQIDEDLDNDLEAELEEATLISDVIHEHLLEGEVCVIVEAGAEKDSYITGAATAINAAGKQISLCLNDIYALAEKQFSIPHELNRAEY